MCRYYPILSLNTLACKQGPGLVDRPIHTYHIVSIQYFLSLRTCEPRDEKVGRATQTPAPSPRQSVRTRVYPFCGGSPDPLPSHPRSKVPPPWRRRGQKQGPDHVRSGLAAPDSRNGLTPQLGESLDRLVDHWVSPSGNIKFPGSANLDNSSGSVGATNRRHRRRLDAVPISGTGAAGRDPAIAFRRSYWVCRGNIGLRPVA
ncbi:hypothetical protein C8Q73DRAFT_101275 [Cubamyces lactineus]|nr:hypothetical protein C8Q73DRAFT_101275 [Cubamyces lactineus]